MQEAKQKEIERIAQEIRIKMERKEPVPIIRGAFGEVGGCEGIVEKFISEGRGIMCKFYGCPLLYKGYPEHKSVDALGLVKALLTKFSEEFIGRSSFIKLAIILYAVLRRKKFIHTVRVFLFLVKALVLEKLSYTDTKKFCYLVQHVLATSKATARKLWDLDADSPMLLGESRDYIGKREVPMIFLLGIEFLMSVIEYDNAYRFRFQDVISNLNKENVKKNGVRKEINRLFAILISREKNTANQDKWRQLKRLTNAILILSGDARKFFTAFLLELGTEAVSMDESDYYYSLNRPSYDHGGIPYDGRLRDMKRIEEEKGILRFSMKLDVLPPQTTAKTTGIGEIKCSKPHGTGGLECETVGCKYTMINHIHVCEECGLVTKIEKKKDVNST